MAKLIVESVLSASIDMPILLCLVIVDAIIASSIVGSLLAKLAPLLYVPCI